MSSILPWSAPYLLLSSLTSGTSSSWPQFAARPLEAVTSQCGWQSSEDCLVAHVKWPQAGNRLQLNLACGRPSPRKPQPAYPVAGSVWARTTPRVTSEIHIILKLPNTKNIEKDNISSQAGGKEACFCLHERSCIILSRRMVLLLLLLFGRMARVVDTNVEYQKGGP